MENIKKIICSDIMSVRNGKTGNIGIMTAVIIISMVAGVFVLPLFGMLGMSFLPIFTSMFFETESRYHSEKLYCILPVKCSDVVKARFGFSFAVLAAVCIVEYILLFFAVKFEIPLMSFEDLLKVSDVNINLSALGFLNICYFTIVAMVVYLMGSQLRMNFKKYSNGTVTLGYTKSDIKGLSVIMIFLTVFIILNVTGNLSSVINFIAVLYFKLILFSDGLLYSVMVLAFSLLSFVYAFVCTILEYDSREL